MQQTPEARATRRVHIVDDDPMVLGAVARLLRLNDFDVVTHESAQAFLDAYQRDEPGCALVDVAMPAIDGLALQARLLAEEGPPVVFLSGLEDVPGCATAMRHGAVDFLRKPVDEATLVGALQVALERDAEMRARRNVRREVQRKLDALTDREREILEHVLQGRLNKQTAFELGIAEKTVKVHRARVMAKMGVRSVAALVRMMERSLGQSLDLRPRSPALE
jgi:FixJ family two-component response regulator